MQRHLLPVRDIDILRKPRARGALEFFSTLLEFAARMQDIKSRVVSRTDHAPGLFSLHCSAPDLARTVAAGQFAMVGVPGRSRPFLRRAFSVANVDADRGTVEFLVKVIGVGTTCLAGLTPGAEVELLAPLGNAFTVSDLSRGDRVAIVAGGVGVAPFPLLLRALSARGIDADLYFGGRSEPDLAYGQTITPFVTGRVLLSTDDGSRGERARVTDLFAREISRGTVYRRLFACGPTPMFRTLSRTLATASAIRAEFSTEAPMGCGFGVCLACVLPRPGGGFLVSCQEGPILAPERVDWAAC
jgi:dihydroorotate dehydrogenase electron transfer subunit